VKTDKIEFSPSVIRFVEESNRIEGINRTPERHELNEFVRFMELPVVTVADLEKFVSVYQPGAVLRDKVGLNVRVANHIPQRGGPAVRDELEDILATANNSLPWVDKQSASLLAYHMHIRYEQLHPFTDGNGRSGRMLWAWQMRTFPLGFLHQFYYQTLANSRS
jgi:hypothetical protein